MTNQELLSAMQASGQLIVGHVGDTKPKAHNNDKPGSPQTSITLERRNGQKQSVYVCEGSDGKSFRVVLDDAIHFIHDGMTLEQAVKRQQHRQSMVVWPDNPEWWFRAPTVQGIVIAKEKFTEHFGDFACEGDTITCEREGYTVTARIERDEHHGIDDDDCHSVDQSVTGCSDEQFKHLMECRAAWKNDEWFYCGIILSVEFNGVEISESAASLWGIECNYPTVEPENGNNHYLTAVANELLNEAIETSKKEHAALIERLTRV